MESTLERKIKKLFEARGGKFYKWVSPGVVGVPDRIGLLPGGRIMFIEVKNPDKSGRLSKRQAKEIENLKRLGFEAYVIDSIEEMRRIIDEQS